MALEKILFSQVYIWTLLITSSGEMICLSQEERKMWMGILTVIKLMAMTLTIEFAGRKILKRKWWKCKGKWTNKKK